MLNVDSQVVCLSILKIYEPRRARRDTKKRDTKKHEGKNLIIIVPLVYRNSLSPSCSSLLLKNILKRLVVEVEIIQEAGFLNFQVKSVYVYYLIYQYV
jgi:hypothetical protein